MNPPTQKCLTLALLLLCWIQLPTLSQDKEKPPKALNPDKWTTEAYYFPDYSFVQKFHSYNLWTEKTAVPKADASAAELKTFLRENNQVAKKVLALNNFNLPQGSLVIYDPISETLVARVPRSVHSTFLFRQEVVKQTKLGNISTHFIVFEAPAVLIRSIIERASTTWDHTELLQTLEKAVKDGEAKTIEESFVEGTVDSKLGIHNTSNDSELTINPKNKIEYYSFEKTRTACQIDLDTSSFGDLIPITQSEIQIAYAPQVLRKAMFSQQEEIPLSQTVIDRFEAKINSQLTSQNGKANLIAVWTPEQVKQTSENPAMLHAAFITNHIGEPPLNNRLKQIVDTYGVDVVPIPAGKPKYGDPTNEIPAGMILKTYVAKADFLIGYDKEKAKTAKERLEKIGLIFPKGSWAKYLQTSESLTVCIPHDQIAKVDSFMKTDTARFDYPYLALTTHIIEAPTNIFRDIIKQSAKTEDHTEIWNTFTKDKQVSVLSTNYLCCDNLSTSINSVKPDASLDVGLKYTYPFEVGISDETSEQGEPIEGYFETEKIGTQIAVRTGFEKHDSSIDIEFDLEYHYAPPTTSNRFAKITKKSINLDAPTTTFHHANVRTKVNVKAGTMSLLGMWKPKGTPELDKSNIRQGVFFRADIINPLNPLTEKLK